MDHIGNLIPDKDKYLSALPVEPASAPLYQDLPSASVPSVEPEMPVSAPAKAPETPEAELIRMTLYKIKDQVDILIHLLDLGPNLKETLSQFSAPAAPFVPVAAQRETIEQKAMTEFSKVSLPETKCVVTMVRFLTFPKTMPVNPSSLRVIA